MSNLDKRIANLSKERLELLMQKLQTKKGQEILPSERQNNPLPLSFAQQQLWFLDQLIPDSSLYIIPIALRLLGYLDVMALEHSLYELVSRHEALRTTFVHTNGVPGQVVTPISVVQTPILTFIDLSTLSTDQQEIEIRKLCLAEAQRSFDLVHDLLLRTTLLHLTEKTHVLLLTVHHIASDAWSTNILYHELSVLYEAFVKRQPSPLPPLPIQYADFAQWQQDRLQGTLLEKQLTYWQEQLRGVPVLELPTDYPRPAIQSFRGASYTLPPLSIALVKRLKVISEEEGVTLFMTLLAAFQILLMRYSRQEDIAVGSPIANRSPKELEGLIGYFVNMLVLRGDLSGNVSFKEMLRRTRQVTLDAYANLDLPLDQLVGKLQPERSVSYNPLYQVVFQLLNTPQKSLSLEGIVGQPLVVETEVVKGDLVFTFIETELGSLQGEVSYRTDLFTSKTIIHMMDHFQTLVAEISANPTQQIWNIPLLSEEELQQIVIGWNDTVVEYPRNQCIHHLFEDQVLRTPESIAIICGQQQVTYSELNRQANQLARYLRTIGVGSEVRVGICIERSVSLVIGLLGILKAGGVYVPLDHKYPKERLIYMLEAAEVSVLLTCQNLVEANILQRVSVVYLENSLESTALQSQENVSRTGVSDNLAYILYTSGSTGEPKGVCVTHKNVVRLVKENNYVSMNSDEVFLLFAPLTFDASTFELWGCLLNGARLIIPPPHMPTLHELGELLLRYQVTTLWLTAGLFHQMVEVNLEGFLSIRQLLTGGDVLSISHVRRAIQELGDDRIINGYGPTEGTTFTCCYTVTASSLLNTSVQIGRPIANTEVYLLDAWLQPIPIGVAGELYIGGDGLARGYLNCPDLTATSFIPHPFSRIPGQRLYRTGDLARYREDGTIEFLGRQDKQVKIRGFRIELGEIEIVLNQHPAIQEAVLLIRENAPDTKSLVAYILPREQQKLSKSELHTYMEEKLPSYMIPSRFVFLDELPLTVNGKLDRQALAKMTSSQVADERNFALPRTPVEERLADIWKRVLGLAQVSIYDNFFEVGGDSLLSVRAAALASQAGLGITTLQMLQHQTIAELSRVATNMPIIRAEQGLVQGSVPFTSAQSYFFNELQSFNPHHSNGAVLLKTLQPLDCDLLEQTIQHLYRYHDALRLRFIQKEYEWEQSIINDGALDLPPISWINLSELPNDEQITTVEKMASQLQTMLHLTNGPLMRLAYFDFGNQKQGRLLWVIHHMITDGFSNDILIQDFQTVYQQLQHGEEVRLPSKTTSFKAWAERQYSFAQSAILQKELEEYWLTLPWEKLVPLPLDCPEGKAIDTLASSRTVETALSTEETSVLLEQVLDADTQILDILLTALVWGCTRWTGSPLVYVRVLDHGRETIFDDIDLSRTIGFIAFGKRLLLDAAGSRVPEDILRLVKEQLRRVPNRGIGYSLLHHLSEDKYTKTRLQVIPPFREINFDYINYTSHIKPILAEAPLFELAREEKGPTRGLDEYRDCTLACTCIVTDYQLRVLWEYGESIHRRATIEALAQDHIEAVRVLIKYLHKKTL